MGNAKWVGDLLWDCLNLNWSKFHVKHPEITNGHYKGKRAYWRAKLMTGEIVMPPEPSKSWEAAAYNRETNEWDVTTLHSYDHTSPSEPIPQAAPARITPSRRKPVTRPYRSLFVFSDAQIDYRRIMDHETGQDELVPIHDERAMQVARMICRDIQPDEIIDLGDTVDMAVLSRFKQDSDHFLRTLTASFQRAHNYYAELKSDNPQAKFTVVDSNHNVRLKNTLLKNHPAIYDLRQAGNHDDFPVMTFPHLANLKHLGINWVSGYGAAEYQYADDLIFKHGDISVSRGSTAAKLSGLNPDVNVVQGHAHRAETATRTTRAGKYLSAVVCGALCKTTGEVPGYGTGVDDMNQPVHKQMNWTQGVLHIRDYGEGNYSFEHILIRDGLSYYDGKLYRADEV